MSPIAPDVLYMPAKGYLQFAKMYVATLNFKKSFGRHFLWTFIQGRDGRLLHRAMPAHLLWSPCLCFWKEMEFVLFGTIYFTRSLAVTKRMCICCVGQFWPNIKTIFCGHYTPVFNHWGAMSEYRLEIWIFVPTESVSPKMSGTRGRLPSTSHTSCPKTRMNGPEICMEAVPLLRNIPKCSKAC